MDSRSPRTNPTVVTRCETRSPKEIEHGFDVEGAGKRLAEHRFASLLSVDLEGKENISAIGAIRTGGPTDFTWHGRSDGLRSALARLDEFAQVLRIWSVTTSSSTTSNSSPGTGQI